MGPSRRETRLKTPCWVWSSLIIQATSGCCRMYLARYTLFRIINGSGRTRAPRSRRQGGSAASNPNGSDPVDYVVDVESCPRLRKQVQVGTARWRGGSGAGGGSCRERRPPPKVKTGCFTRCVGLIYVALARRDRQAVRGVFRNVVNVSVDEIACDRFVRGQGGYNHAIWFVSISSVLPRPDLLRGNTRPLRR